MTALNFIKDLLLSTFSHLVGLLGGFFAFGLLIQLISQLTFKSLEKSFGAKGVYVFAWLGTPVHELGHALFCIIFGHRIEEMALFKPDPVSGTMGYVYHRWNPKNPWQVLGNLFIGIGPMALGCGVLFALFYLLIPGGGSIWQMVGTASGEFAKSSLWKGYFSLFSISFLTIIKLIFAGENLASWRFWVFLYLAASIAANIRLSWADVRGSFSGLGCVAVGFLLLNLVLLLIGLDGAFLALPSSALGVVSSVLMVALVLSLLGFCVVYLVCGVFYWARHRAIPNPFSLLR